MPQVIRPDGIYRSQQRFGLYRWHIMDPIRFESDLRVTIQALGWRTREGTGAICRCRTTSPRSPTGTRPCRPRPSRLCPIGTIWKSSKARASCETAWKSARRLSRTRLCRRAGQADRRLSGTAVRELDLWPHRRELGPIEYYVHDRLDCPLIVTDDDIAGTFTFIRALEDHGARADITSPEIGQTWLNYIVEHRAILWWGGNGNSTEHTAWLNLKRGVRRRRAARWRSTARRWPSRSAPRFSSTAGRSSRRRPDSRRPARRAGGRVSHDGAPSTPPNCGRRWRRRPSSRATSII